MENKINCSTTLCENISSYRVEKKTFLVQPVFPKIGKETLGTVLLRMIQSDIEYAKRDQVP